MEQQNLALGLVAGANLKRLIKCSPYKTQEAFAEAVGANVRTIRRWIARGFQELTLLEELAKKLDIDVLAFLSR